MLALILAALSTMSAPVDAPRHEHVTSVPSFRSSISHETAPDGFRQLATGGFVKPLDMSKGGGRKKH